MGCNGLAWWAGGLVCAAGALESYWMEDPDRRQDRPASEGEESTCEPLLHPSVVETNDDLLSPRVERMTFMDDLDLSATTPEKA